MKPTQTLHDFGQSLWLDNITRTMLDDGTLKGYIDELSVTGLTSNPTIFEKAITAGDTYNEQLAQLRERDLEPEDTFFEIAITDLRRAADLFADIHDGTDGVDGFVSLEVSPLLADDTDATTTQAADLHGKADRPNVFIKIPGTPAGLSSIEETIYAGTPVNVTLLFSTEQYLAAADAYLKGIERRIADGLSPHVASVASLFLSRWDVAVADEVPDELRNTLGVAVGRNAYVAYRELLASDRMQRLENWGARPQRLLYASTGTKDPDASETLYIEGLASANTVNTMPEKTLLATAEGADFSAGPIPPDGGDSDEVLAKFGDAGVDLGELAARLQEEGKDSFNKSWNELVESISAEAEKAAT